MISNILERLDDIFATRRVREFWFLGVALLSGLYNFFQSLKGINFDDFFNLSIGRYIVETHSFPTVDHFTWLGIEKGFSMTAYQWLYNVLLYLSYQSVGWWALRVGIVGAVMASIYLVYRIIWRITGDTLFALFFGTLIAFFMIIDENLMFQFRPQSFVIPLFLLELLLLVSLKGSDKRIWWFLPINVLIVNIHAGMLPVVVIFSFWAFLRWSNWRFSLLASLMIFINPYPLGNIITIFAFLKYKDTISSFVKEWRPLWELPVYWGDKMEAGGIFIPQAGMVVLIFIYCLLLILLILQYKKDLQEALFLSCVAALWLGGVRYSILILFLLLPYLLVNILPIWRHTSTPTVRFLEWTFTLILPLLLAYNIVYVATHQEIFYNGLESIEAPELVEYMKDNGIDRYYNYNFGAGGYLGWMGVPPMYDNRNAIYLPPSNSEGFNYAEEYAELENNPEAIRRLMNKYNLRYALMGNDAPVRNMEVFLEDEADILYMDDNYILLRIYLPLKN